MLCVLSIQTYWNLLRPVFLFFFFFLWPHKILLNKDREGTPWISQSQEVRIYCVYHCVKGSPVIKTTTHKSKSKFQRKNINKYIFGIYTHTEHSAGGVLGGGGLIIRRMQHNITLCTTMRLVHFFYKLRVPPWVAGLQSRQSITAILWKFAYYTLYYPLDYNIRDNIWYFSEC